MSSSRVPHDVSTHPHQPEVSGPAPVRQWLGLLLPAAAFVVHFQLNYLLVLWVCGNDVSTLPIHLTSIVALLVCLFGVRLAFSTWWSGPGGASAPDRCWLRPMIGGSSMR